MLVKGRTFAVGLILALIAGLAIGALATPRARMARAPLAQAAPSMLEAPVIPVQMPLTTGTFAKVAEVIKPAVININTVARGGTGPGRTPGNLRP